jgi:long-chain acyl-CoA synthetase
MENNDRYVECCGAGVRAGLYYTCVNSYLKADELAYILINSQSRVVITTREKRDVLREALAQCPNVTRCLMVGGGANPDLRFGDFDAALARFPESPIADEWLGTAMLYSSGTTGRPKGVLRPLPAEPPSYQLPLFAFLDKLWHCREGMIYLSPAPLYTLRRRPRCRWRSRPAAR